MFECSLGIYMEGKYKLMIWFIFQEFDLIAVDKLGLDPGVFSGCNVCPDFIGSGWCKMVACRRNVHLSVALFIHVDLSIQWFTPSLKKNKNYVSE